MSYRAIWMRTPAPPRSVWASRCSSGPPRLAADPLGETLLKQFQRLLKIVETESDGKVDRASWSAISTIDTRSPPVVNVINT